MGNVELIVRIPEEAYQLLKNKGVDWLGAEHILHAVANGTPLQKGHGKLIDSEAYYADVKKHYFDNDTVIRCTKIALHNAETVIKADKDKEINADADSN